MFFRKNHTVSQSSDGDSDLLNISAVHTVSQQYTEDRYTISPKSKIAYNLHYFISGDWRSMNTCDVPQVQ